MGKKKASQGKKHSPKGDSQERFHTYYRHEGDSESCYYWQQFPDMGQHMSQHSDLPHSALFSCRRLKKTAYSFRANQVVARECIRTAGYGSIRPSHVGSECSADAGTHAAIGTRERPFQFNLYCWFLYSRKGLPTVTWITPHTATGQSARDDAAHRILISGIGPRFLVAPIEASCWSLRVKPRDFREPHQPDATRPPLAAKINPFVSPPNQH
jgi:hypothetical protein